MEKMYRAVVWDGMKEKVVRGNPMSFREAMADCNKIMAKEFGRTIGINSEVERVTRLGNGNVWMAKF